MQVCLHVGCGRQSTEILPPFDWGKTWKEVRVDINPSVAPDIVASIVDLKPVADDSADMIFSKHNLEHLEYHDVRTCLANFRRVLKPTGFAVIRTPDLRAIARILLEHDVDRNLYSRQVAGNPCDIAPIDMLYGLRSELEQGNQFMAHRSGFTKGSLARLLQEAGFQGISVKERPESSELLAIAMKVEAGNLFHSV